MTITLNAMSVIEGIFDMHAHACYILCMRTTIEITAEQRSKLMALAALNNEKGFSRFVREAIDEYLESRLSAQEKINRALSARGILQGDDADAFINVCAEIRENWR